jgi:hypothetical protein
MKHILWLPIAIPLLAAAAWTQSLPDNPEPAKPMTSGWNRVRDLAQGDEITVDAGKRHTIHCSFAGATDQTLFCDPHYGWLGRGESQFDQAEVETVRQSHEKRNRWLLIAAMGSAGGIVVGLRDANPYNSERVLEGMFGAALSGAISYPIAALGAHFIPGSLLYRRPRQDHAMFP